VDIEVHPTRPLIYASDVIRPTPSHIKAIEYASGSLAVAQTTATADELRGMAITSDGLFLITTHIFPQPRVDLYSIDALGNVSATPIDSETPAAVTDRFKDVVVDPTTATAYVVDLDAGVYAYSLVGGALTPLNGGAPYPTGGVLLTDIAVAGGILFASSRNLDVTTNLSTFRIGPTGELTYVSTVVVPSAVESLAVNKEGSILLGSERITSSGNNLIRSFRVDTTAMLIENAGSPFAVPNTMPNSTSALGDLLIVQR